MTLIFRKPFEVRVYKKSYCVTFNDKVSACFNSVCYVFADVAPIFSVSTNNEFFGLELVVSRFELISSEVFYNSTF